MVCGRLCCTFRCEKQEVPLCQELNTAEHSLALRVEVDVPGVEQVLQQSRSPTLVFAACFSTATKTPECDVLEVKALMFYYFNTDTDTESVKELMASEMPLSAVDCWLS